MIQVGEAPTCQEIVEAVTDYLEGALSEEDCACFEQHLVLCGGCDEIVHQTRLVVRTSGELTPAVDAEDGAVQELLEVFRAHRLKGLP